MSESLRVLGQVAPAADTDVDIYTVPEGRAAVISSLFVTNRGGVEGTFCIAIRPGGVDLAPLHYIYFDIFIYSNDVIRIGAGITLADGDVITVRASTADLSFNVFGSEVVV